MVISARQTGHSPSITDTCMADASQSCACPHGTSAKPARGAMRHTSQQSSEVVVAAAVADSDAPDVPPVLVFVLAAAAAAAVIVVPRL